MSTWRIAASGARPARAAGGPLEGREASSMGGLPEVRVAAPACSLPRSGEADLGGDGGQGIDDEADVRVQIHAELDDSTVDVVAIDRSRERLVLELLFHRRRFHARDDDLAGADEGAGVDESRQFV